MEPLHGLARALDVPLAELLHGEAAPRPPLPASLVAFTADTRYGCEVGRLARGESLDAATVRAQLVAAMMTVLPSRLDQPHRHRVLDVIVLVRRPR